MSDQHRRQASLALQPPELAPQLLADGRVQRGERLVKQDQARAVAQRPGQADTLPLPAGKLAGQPILQAVEVQSAEPPGG